MLNKLSEISTYYNLGHEFGGTDKESYHKYCSTFYDKEFLKYKEKPISLFEIGVLKFGSLIMWDHYFRHMDAKIYGVDIMQYENISKIEKLNRVKFLIGNAYDQSFVNTLPNVDIIIDDGPHTKESQINFLKLYLPKLNEGGTLIIEDVQNLEYITEYGKMISYPLFPTIVDIRHISGIKDSILFIIRK